MEPKDRGSESCLTPTTLERTLGAFTRHYNPQAPFYLSFQESEKQMHDLWCSGTKTDHKPAMVCGFDLGCRRRSSTGQYLMVNERTACETQV